MKLELKHLKNYLGTELKGKYKLSDVIKLGNNQKDEIRDIKLIGDNVNFFLLYGKPILRPLSDLTKSCLENGKTPIIELMDESFNTNWAKTEYIYTDSGKNEWWVAFKSQNSCFGYNLEKQGFYSINGHGKDLYVHNQLQLFEKLFEWHFDIYGLIEQGLAIDINTLV